MTECRPQVFIGNKKYLKRQETDLKLFNLLIL